MANKPGADQILHGRIPGVLSRDEYVRVFLEQLKIPLMQTRISAKIRTSDFKGYWGQARERTSSSMSGLHFGHYK